MSKILVVEERLYGISVQYHIKNYVVWPKFVFDIFNYIPGVHFALFSG